MECLLTSMSRACAASTVACHSSAVRRLLRHTTLVKCNVTVWLWLHANSIRSCNVSKSSVSSKTRPTAVDACAGGGASMELSVRASTQLGDRFRCRSAGS